MGMSFGGRFGRVRVSRKGVGISAGHRIARVHVNANGSTRFSSTVGPATYSTTLRQGQSRTRTSTQQGSNYDPPHSNDDSSPSNYDRLPTGPDEFSRVADFLIRLGVAFLILIGFFIVLAVFRSFSEPTSNSAPEATTPNSSAAPTAPPTRQPLPSDQVEEPLPAPDDSLSAYIGSRADDRAAVLQALEAAGLPCLVDWQYIMGYAAYCEEPEVYVFHAPSTTPDEQADLPQRMENMSAYYKQIYTYSGDIVQGENWIVGAEHEYLAQLETLGGTIGGS